MRKERLSERFTGVAVRRLTPNDVNLEVSNGHELDSSAELRQMLGDTPWIKENRLPTTCFYFSDQEDYPVRAEILCSWYDCRANQPHRKPEWRLYYQDCAILGVEGLAKAGDLLFVAINPDRSLLTIILADRGSSFETKLLWFFGLSERQSSQFETNELDRVERDASDFASRQIAEVLEIELDLDDDYLLELLTKEFGRAFPKSAAFSTFARCHSSVPDPLTDPDAALLGWINFEEILFRTLEKAILQERLNVSFRDVDDFISYSLSVQNRRKSRAGYSFENHLN